MQRDSVTDEAADILRGAEARADARPEILESELPDFPESAWRGSFADYRSAMQDTTEASDVFHFAAFWAGSAVSLGRNVWTFSGERIYPNFYGIVYGSTGDKKTTAQRQILNCGLLPGSVQIIRNLGSTEGLAAKFKREDGADAVSLMFWEEVTSLFARGRWSGSTILEFITECFDCPPEWGLEYTKNPIRIKNPTPTILAGTTPEWFWKNARADDFHGGFGNRFAYFAGKKKAARPNPEEPNDPALELVRNALRGLSSIAPTKAEFNSDAAKLWERFYMKWENTDRPGLYGAATKRIHVYVRKVAMTYAALEGTLPAITFDQLKAAIAVGLYCAECARLLVDAQNSAIRPEGQIERRFTDWVTRHPGRSKRFMQQTLSKVAGSCEVFNRTMASLIRADQIELRDVKVYPTVSG